MARPRASIVEFRPELAGAFRDLNVEWLEKHFRVEPIDRLILDEPEERIIATGGLILFAELQGEIVGTVALKHHGGGVYELTKMAVTPRRRGAGIGRDLLAACLERYRRMGGNRLYLESHSSLLPALALYASAGFVRMDPPAPSVYGRADVYMRYIAPDSHENQSLE